MGHLHAQLFHQCHHHQWKLQKLRHRVKRQLKPVQEPRPELLPVLQPKLQLEDLQSLVHPVKLEAKEKLPENPKELQEVAEVTNPQLARSQNPEQDQRVEQQMVNGAEMRMETRKVKRK